MADLNRPRLSWPGGAGDPGLRETTLPPAAPLVGDDFDWHQRDFESFRQAMWQELQTQFPERRRWSAGDLEAVLVELFAAHLDQLSDMADRVSAESYLETARRPASVLKWLDFIGYDPVAERGLERASALELLYRSKPHEMARDKRRGPAAIRRQRRMASLDDYGERLEEHPLVLRAGARQQWTGALWEMVTTVQLWNDLRLDDRVSNAPPAFVLPRRVVEQLDAFQKAHSLRAISLDQAPTVRELLLDHVRCYRITGHVTSLVDVVPVGIALEVLVTLKDNYFQSEVRREVARALGRGPEGFFRPGRLRFGQDLQQSDIYGALMPLLGVHRVEICKFERAAAPSTTTESTLKMGSDELAVCEGRDSSSRERGYLTIQVQGGRIG